MYICPFMHSTTAGLGMNSTFQTDFFPLRLQILIRSQVFIYIYKDAINIYHAF